MNIDFVVPGFSKCGTTTLCDLLNSHSEVFIPPGKEPGYFAENFGRGWDWYMESFASRKNQRLVGEGSTTYSSLEFADVALDRILDHSPECKFIFIARDPMKRLESSFREMHASGYKYGIAPSFQFSEALDQLPNMVADSLYHRIIQIFRARVQSNRIHVLFLEDLNRDPATAYRDCLRFLGLPQEELSNQGRQLNSASTKVCDTQVLRWIRTNPVTSRWWGKLTLSRQEFLMANLKLQKPFNPKVEWDSAARAVFASAIAPDARRFLEAHGKPESFWNLADGGQQQKAA